MTTRPDLVVGASACGNGAACGKAADPVVVWLPALSGVVVVGPVAGAVGGGALVVRLAIGDVAVGLTAGDVDAGVDVPLGTCGSPPRLGRVAVGVSAAMAAG